MNYGVNKAVTVHSSIATQQQITADVAPLRFATEVKRQPLGALGYTSIKHWDQEGS